MPDRVGLSKDRLWSERNSHDYRLRVPAKDFSKDHFMCSDKDIF